MVKMTCFRFNLDNPEHAKAWEYLHSIDKDKVKSGNTAVVKAVNEYFDRMQKLSDDPYFENRQREERFVQQIVSEVGKAFIAEMPKFLASLMLGLSAGYPIPTPQTAVSSVTESNNNTENGDNVDYSAIDFGFIGG
ncbi:hypothetical protein [Ruminococcus sp. NK3A76]|uniref:hypothetical protein n=1 Tax=Ruminococcus sp. NK3A76 TaxID=877411 RepID=UPI0005656E6B|nr:hypothetical protein [Ruminococcus sp. NK3A76]